MIFVGLLVYPSVLCVVVPNVFVGTKTILTATHRNKGKSTNQQYHKPNTFMAIAP
jgi:hypothetical protein